MKKATPNQSVVRFAAMLMGAFFAFLGLLTLFFISGLTVDQNPAGPKNLALGYFAALIFIAAGTAMILFGLRWTAAAGKLGAVAVLIFVLAFNWIAFVPGERNFTHKSKTSFSSSPKTPISETEGRMVFGIFALLMDGVIVYGLIKAAQGKNLQKTAGKSGDRNQRNQGR